MSSWSYSQITTLVTPAGTITFNSGADHLFIDPRRSTGLGESEVRTTIIDKGQTDGYTVLPAFEEGQHLVLAGTVIVTSSGTESGTVTARNTLLTDTRTKMKSILAADGTLNFSTGDSMTVRCEILPKAMDAWIKSFLLGLVSPTPA